MANNKLVLDEEVLSVVKEVKLVLEVARSNVAHQVNSELLNTYWNIGRIICEHEQSNPERADYGKQTLKELAKENQPIHRETKCNHHSTTTTKRNQVLTR